MHSKTIEEVAWLAGIAACEHGMSKDKCPYKDTGPQSAIIQWQSGYALAAALLPRKATTCSN
jgi:ribosome modulation factor